MKKIKDEFSEKPVSRQRKYQLRMAKLNKCRQCGGRVFKGGLCSEHYSVKLESQRKPKKIPILE